MRLTVKDLKAIIDELSDDTPVYMSRVEDFYFVVANWKTESILGHGDGEMGGECFQASRCYIDKARLIIDAHY